MYFHKSLCKIDLQSNKVLWTFDFETIKDRYISCPVIDDNENIYCISTYEIGLYEFLNEVYFITKEGELKWKVEDIKSDTRNFEIKAMDSSGKIYIFGHRGDDPIAIDSNGTVTKLCEKNIQFSTSQYIYTDKEYIYDTGYGVKAYNASFDEVWKYVNPDGYKRRNSYALADEYIYIYDVNLVKLNKFSGEKEWEVKPNRGYMYPLKVVTKDMIYGIDIEDGKGYILIANKTSTGEELWTLNLGKNPIYGIYIDVKGRIYIQSKEDDPNNEFKSTTIIRCYDNVDENSKNRKLNKSI